jgi:hypothetical protein
MHRTERLVFRAVRALFGAKVRTDGGVRARR